MRWKRHGVATDVTTEEGKGSECGVMLPVAPSAAGGRGS